ncbi:MAG: helix-turn-helix transcriptional regulator [Planctomycetaceae bacterium]
MVLDKNSNHRDRQLLLLRIDRYCHRKCISQQDLAKKAGISRTFFSNLQRGKVRWPQTNTLVKLADALDISTEELCDCDNERQLQLQAESDQVAPETSVLDRRTNPVVTEVYREHPSLFQGWRESEWDEIYSTFGVGGALTEAGVKQAADQINQKRELVRQVQVLYETHKRDQLVEMIHQLYQGVQPQAHLYNSNR